MIFFFFCKPSILNLPAAIGVLFNVFINSSQEQQHTVIAYWMVLQMNVLKTTIGFVNCKPLTLNLPVTAGVFWCFYSTQEPQYMYS